MNRKDSMKLSWLFSKFVGSLYCLTNNFFHIILKVLKSLSILETIAMSKIYHTLYMEALCQTIKKTPKVLLFLF